MTVRVIIADDHPVFLAGLNLLLTTSPEIEVLGTAADGEELLELAATTEFDVAVVDLDMPRLDGASATRQLLATHSGAAVLILTMHDDEVSLGRALRAGARGYVLKGSGHGSIGRAILAVAEGDTVLSGAAGHAVREALSRPGEAAALLGLTPREHEILTLLASGAENPAIARTLYLSTKTVQNHVSTLLTKLGAGSRAHLVALAHDAGVGRRA